MRILFAGSPVIAVPSLEALARLSLEDARFRLVGVLTNPDTKRGRRGDPEPTDIGAAADRLSGDFAGIPAPVQFKPEKPDGAVREAVAALKPDLLVSFAYGHIFGPRFLSLFPLGGINVHPSLLPKYRGATPIPAAILGRDRETGVTIQRLAPEMDAGDILAQERFPLNGRETTLSLSRIAAEKGAELLLTALHDLALDSAAGRRQNNDEATYCSIISKEDGLIDWSQGAAEIDAKIRAYTPWPLCRTFHGEEPLYILEGGLPEEPVQAENAGPLLPGTVLGIDRNSGILVQTGDGVFAVQRLQYAAKKALAWRDFLNGARDFIGARLTGLV
ncbi:methionyl-tRNA formyltransferase [Treponema primitia]|uniref:methionyl-tRNA formyltransferase n=1 Tax=Treponema primitia TaxID=88058 RepID=UPI003981057B